MAITRHADHDPALICRPAFGNGLCEPLPPDIPTDEPRHITEAEYVALLPRRMQEIADQLSEGLPEGFRFEWGPVPE